MAAAYNEHVVEPIHNANLTLQVRQEQINQIYSNINNVVIGQLAAGVVGTTVLWSVVPAQKLLWWLGIFSLYQVLRHLFWRQYHTQPKPLSEHNLSFWARTHTLGSALSATIWSAGIILLWPADSAFHQVSFLFIVIATTSAAIVGHAAYKPTYVAYTALTLFPMSVRFFIENTQSHITIGIGILIYLIMLFRFSDVSNKSAIDALVIGIKYREQADSLAEEKARTEMLNQQLVEQTQALQQSEARFRALSQSTFEGIAIHHSRVILDVNQAATDMFGYAQAELVGMNLFDLITPEFHSLAAEYAREGYEDPYEVQGLRKDGSVFPLEVQAKSTSYQGNDVYVVAARDITVRKQAEQQALALKLEQERVKLLTTFFQSASHEFQTPLSIIKTAVYVNRRSNDPDKQRKNLDQIEAQSARIEGLVSDLAFMLQLDTDIALDYEQLDLNHMLQSCCTNLKPEIESKQQVLTFQPPDSLPSLHADGNLLTKAIDAVLQNAVRYTPSDGSIRVQVLTKDDTVTIAIEDSGIGIAGEALPHIFERFYRVDEAHSSAGFGIGLSIAKKIIELHHGTISAESTIDAGSTITIQLPIRQV